MYIGNKQQRRLPMETILDRVDREGITKVRDGYWVVSSLYAIADQETWGIEDEGKKIDFTRYPYWLMCDDGACVGFTDESALGRIM